MPVIKKIIQIDDLYERTGNKVVLNDIKLSSDNIKELIYTVYDDVISLVPSCECKHLNKGYLLGRRCEKCGTYVENTFGHVKPILWIKKFDDGLKFMNPQVWIMLSRIINVKVDGMRWLADTTYNPPNVPQVLFGLKTIIGGRGYLNVVNNIDSIITYLLHHSQLKTITKQNKLLALQNILKKDRSKLFSDYLPLINKKLFVVEKSSMGDYASILLADIIDVALLAVTTANGQELSERRLHNNTAKLIAKSAALFVNYVDSLVSKKGGLARKNIYGTRSHFTFRCVASSLDTMYDYDTIHIPWQIGPTAFRPHLLNKLDKLGYTLKKASQLLFDSTIKYDPLIDRLLNELIEESPYKGIPVLLNRNPSLKVGSIQLVYVTRFKTDLNDNTIGVNIMIAPAPNLDFDGDEINITILLDNQLADMAVSFAPHVNVPSMGIFEISGHLNIPKTAMITLMSYMSDDIEQTGDIDSVMEEMLALT